MLRYTVSYGDFRRLDGIITKRHLSGETNEIFSMFNSEDIVKEDVEEVITGEYIKKSLKQVILGHYTEDETALGAGIQIFTSIAGIDLPADIRDIVYDIQHWETSKEHIAQTAIDTIALLPLVGSIKPVTKGLKLALKNIDKVDEASTLIKSGLKNIDKVDEASTLIKSGIKNIDKVDETSKLAKLGKNTNEVSKITTKGTGNRTVEELTDLLKNGEIKGNNIISKIDDETQIIFRQDTGVNAHPMKTKGYKDVVDHYNIEIQTKTPAGKWKSKWSYHIVLDELKNIIDFFE